MPADRVTWEARDGAPERFVHGMRVFPFGESAPADISAIVIPGAAGFRPCARACRLLPAGKSPLTHDLARKRIRRPATGGSGCQCVGSSPLSGS